MFGHSADARGRCYRNFASLVNAGVSILDALESIGQGLTHRDRKMYERFVMSIRSGLPLHRAMIDAPPLDRALVRVGEANGTLTETLSYLATYYDERHALRRSIQSALVKPAFLIVASVLLSDVPKLVAGEFTLPVYLMRTLPPLAVLAILAVILIQYVSQTDGRILLKVPWIGGKVERFALERFFLCLELGIRSGCSLDASLDLASAMVSNPKLKQAINIARARQTRVGFSEALSQTKAFDERYLMDLRTGERAGQLDETFRRIRSDLHQKNLETIEQFKDWTPKIIYMLAAFYVAWGIVRSFTAIMNQAFDRMP